MEFLNIGGGELLIIVLLAIVLFGPEDILKLMRTIGEYTRKVQQMWAQMSAGLKGDFLTDEIIPKEVKETIKETQASVADLQKTLADVKASAEADLSETKAVVENVKTTLEDISTSVAAGVGEVPKALEATLNEPVSGEVVPIATPETSTPLTASDPEPPETILSSALASTEVPTTEEDTSAPVPIPVSTEVHSNDEDE